MSSDVESLRVPAPTAWPFVLALGLTLLAAGLVTTLAVSVVGGLVGIAAAVGWFRQVLPHEQDELVEIGPHEPAPAPAPPPRPAERAEPPRPRRARLPVEAYPVSAGLKGGFAGAFAMALIAMMYGLVAYGSIWYPINLLAAAVYPGPLDISTTAIASFSASDLIVASVIHLVTSLLVGLLYGAMLPMLPRHPVLLGGIVAPLMWSGLLDAILQIINPLLYAHIDWMWFVASQVAFGVVAGIVVSHQTRISTMQHLPLAVRAGVETPGLMTFEARTKGDQR
jgi:hypothetical protein